MEEKQLPENIQVVLDIYRDKLLKIEFGNGRYILEVKETDSFFEYRLSVQTTFGLLSSGVNLEKKELSLDTFVIAETIDRMINSTKRNIVKKAVETK